MELAQLTHLSASAAATLVGAAWQGLALVLVVAAALKLVPGISAAARSIVWTAVLLLVVALPFVQPGGAGSAGYAGRGAALQFDERWSVLVVAIWTLLSAVRLLQLARSAAFLRRIARNATSVGSDAALAPLLQHGRVPVALCVSDEVVRPSVVGFLQPKILIPATLFARLSTAELQQIVLHEMEHLRRHDDWTNLLQKLALAVFPLNPALVWIERRLCLERELACDDGVLRATGARKAYAECLANLAEHTLVQRGVSLALGAWERQSELVRRVHRILTGGTGEMGRRPAAVAVSLMLAGVMASGDLLAHSPRLVSFGPAAVPLLAAKGEGTGPRAVFVRGSEAMSGKQGMARAIMAKAIMPSATQAAPARRVSTRLRVRAVRRPLPLMAEQIEFHAVPQRVQATAPDAGMVVMVTWQMAVPAPQQTLQQQGSQQQEQSAAAQTGSHFSYAAVPVRNGWLFVQL